ncbi:MAG: PHP domain-containing protein [Clostridia bacterium]|nr:PHP domain-containing protein [Clostridia bacterium]
MKKRAELSLHTNMCSKLGICDVKEYIIEAAIENMTAIAITDTTSVQSFPRALTRR